MRVLYSSRELIESRSKSALDISATEKKLTEGKTELIKQKDHMKINEQSLQHLNLHPSESQPVLETWPLSWPVQGNGRKDQPCTEILNQPRKENPSYLPLATPKPQDTQTPGTSSTCLATPATQDVPTQKFNHNLLHDATPIPIHGIEDLVRQHIGISRFVSLCNNQGLRILKVL